LAEAGPGFPVKGEVVVKKIVVAGLAAASGILVALKLRSGKKEQDLWAEATDSVPTDKT
jgi:hypothetical protein